MKALVICTDEPFAAFQDLERNPWLLPVAGKTVIEYQLETLGQLGLKEIRIVGADPEIERRFGSGQSLGLQLSYGAPSFENTVQSTLRHHLSYVKDSGLVVVQGLHLLAPLLASHCLRLNQSVRLGEGVWGLTPEAVKALLQGASEADFLQSLPLLPRCESWPLNSLKDYHQANLKIASGWSENISLPAYGQVQGYHCGSKLTLAKDLVCKGHGYIGSQTVIQRQVELQDACLGQGVVVAQGTQIVRSVVLDGSWIGPQLTLEDKIVVGRRLIDPLTEEMVVLEEPGWLDVLQARDLASPLERMFAGLLWLLLLPLYAVLAPSQTRTLKAYPLKNKTLQFPDFSQNASKLSGLFERFSLDRVPFLQAVMRNQLALVGQLPLELGRENPYADYLPAAFAYSEWLGSDQTQALLDDASYPLFRSSKSSYRICLQILWRSLTKSSSPRHAIKISDQKTGRRFEKLLKAIPAKSLMAQR